MTFDLVDGRYNTGNFLKLFQMMDLEIADADGKYTAGFKKFGGGVSKAGKPLTDCIQKYYQKYAFPSCKSTPIILASLGNDAGIYGAARMVIKD